MLLSVRIKRDWLYKDFTIAINTISSKINIKTKGWSCYDPQIEKFRKEVKKKSRFHKSDLFIRLKFIIQMFTIWYSNLVTLFHQVKLTSFYEFMPPKINNDHNCEVIVLIWTKVYQKDFSTDFKREIRGHRTTI